MPLIKKNDTKSVAYLLSNKEKQILRESKRSGASKTQLLQTVNTMFGNNETKRKAAIRFTEGLFQTLAVSVSNELPSQTQ